MIRIAGLNKNDVINGEGVSVSLFLQGCHFHCKGCHNPETWDPKGGIEYDEDELINEIIEAISANGIQRNLSILGGEPLDTIKKIDFLNCLLLTIRKKFLNIKICL
jgi:anaerobic ribonucleoside-triphosphate reductase activating protein